MPKKEDKNDENLDDPKTRRKIRATYRELTNEIQENDIEAETQDSKKLSEYLEEAEDLFSRVRHPREAIHDSNFLVQLSKKGREKAQLLKTDIVSFDNIIFMEKIIAHANGTTRALLQDNDTENGTSKSDTMTTNGWRKLAKQTTSLFKRAPVFEFLLGPLVIEGVAPKQRARNAQQKMPEGQTIKLTQISSVEKEEEATTKEVERIYEVLRKVTNDGTIPVSFFTFIINPKSFGQTIENLFHVSFLVKDDRVIVELDEDELPVINLHTASLNETTSDAHILRKQVVCPFTMTAWKELIEAYEITKPMIPTRGRLEDIT